MKQSRIFCLFGMALVAAASGCGKSELPGPKTITADGTVMVNGKPYGPAVLTFLHSSDKNAPGIEAKVNKDGVFTVLKFSSQGQEPKGKYKVTMAEDPESMMVKGIPVVEPLEVEINAPGEGQSLKLEIKFKSKGGKMTTGGPDPGSGEQPKNTPGGI